MIILGVLEILVNLVVLKVQVGLEILEYRLLLTQFLPVILSFQQDRLIHENLENP
jgi:hypothetical protein